MTSIDSLFKEYSDQVTNINTQQDKSVNIIISNKEAAEQYLADKRKAENDKLEAEKAKAKFQGDVDARVQEVLNSVFPNSFEELKSLEKQQAEARKEKLRLFDAYQAESANTSPLMEGLMNSIGIKSIRQDIAKKHNMAAKKERLLIETTNQMLSEMKATTDYVKNKVHLEEATLKARQDVADKMLTADQNFKNADYEMQTLSNKTNIEAFRIEADDKKLARELTRINAQVRIAEGSAANLNKRLIQSQSVKKAILDMTNRAETEHNRLRKVAGDLQADSVLLGELDKASILKANHNMEVREYAQYLEELAQTTDAKERAKLENKISTMKLKVEESNKKVIAAHLDIDTKLNRLNSERLAASKDRQDKILSNANFLADKLGVTRMNTYNDLLTEAKRSPAMKAVLDKAYLLNPDKPHELFAANNTYDYLKTFTTTSTDEGLGKLQAVLIPEDLRMGTNALMQEASKAFGTDIRYILAGGIKEDIVKKGQLANVVINSSKNFMFSNKEDTGLVKYLAITKADLEQYPKHSMAHELVTQLDVAGEDKLTFSNLPKFFFNIAYGPTTKAPEGVVSYKQERAIADAKMNQYIALANLINAIWITKTSDLIDVGAEVPATPWSYIKYADGLGTPERATQYDLSKPAELREFIQEANRELPMNFWPGKDAYDKVSRDKFYGDK